MSEEKKQKLKEYQKNVEKQKNLNIIINKILYVLLFSKLFFIINIRFDLIVRVTV